MPMNVGNVSPVALSIIQGAFGADQRHYSDLAMAKHIVNELGARGWVLIQDVDLASLSPAPANHSREVAGIVGTVMGELRKAGDNFSITGMAHLLITGLANRGFEIVDRQSEQTVEMRVPPDFTVLAEAIHKFAPDLAAELVKRWTDANGALEDFLKVLRANA